MATTPKIINDASHVVSCEVKNTNTIKHSIALLESQQFHVRPKDEYCTFILLDHLVAIVAFHSNHLAWELVDQSPFDFLTIL